MQELVTSKNLQSQKKIGKKVTHETENLISQEEHRVKALFTLKSLISAIDQLRNKKNSMTLERDSNTFKNIQTKKQTYAQKQKKTEPDNKIKEILENNWKTSKQIDQKQKSMIIEKEKNQLLRPKKYKNEAITVIQECICVKGSRKAQNSSKNIVRIKK